MALTGSMGPGAEKIYDYGIRSIMTTVNGVMDLNDAFNRAEELYYQGAIRMFRLIALGMEL